jgi:GDP-L-fucose synthase
MENYDGPEQVNVGTGEDLEIREIAALVAEVVGYQGRVEWDETKPDGTPRKLLDVSKLRALGWEPKVGLREGLEIAVAEFRLR